MDAKRLFNTLETVTTPGGKAKLARLAYDYAYDNRANIQKWAKRQAAKTIQVAWRKKQHKAKFSTERVGNPQDTDTSKRYQGLQTEFTLRQGRTLGIENVVSTIPHTSVQHINHRDRHMVNLNGFKYCIHLRNNINRPIVFHLAICVDKKHAGEGYGQDFFRDPGDGNKRTKDFDISLTGMQMKCLNINTDRYIVLRHERHTLPPAEVVDTYNKQNPPNYLTLERYQRIKRQIRYDNNEPQTRILIFFWTSPMDVVSGTAAALGEFNMAMNVVTYFKDVNCC